MEVSTFLSICVGLFVLLPNLEFDRVYPYSRWALMVLFYLIILLFYFIFCSVISETLDSNDEMTTALLMWQLRKNLRLIIEKEMYILGRRGKDKGNYKV